MGHDLPDDVSYVEASAGARATIGDLFAPALRLDTAGLFGSFFFCLMVNYVAIQLVPSMLRDSGGFSPAAAAGGLQWVNIGGVIGAVAGALVIQALGSRITMLGMSAVAIACSLVMAGMKLDPADSFALMAMFLVTGGLLNAVQTTMHALAAHVTRRRSAGPASARPSPSGEWATCWLSTWVGLRSTEVGRPATSRRGPC